MLEKKVLLNDYEMNVTVERLCQQLIEHHDSFEIEMSRYLNH